MLLAQGRATVVTEDVLANGAVTGAEATEYMRRHFLSSMVVGSDGVLAFADIWREK